MSWKTMKRFFKIRGVKQTPNNEEDDSLFDILNKLNVAEDTLFCFTADLDLEDLSYIGKALPSDRKKYYTKLMVQNFYELLAIIKECNLLSNFYPEMTDSIDYISGCKDEDIVGRFKFRNLGNIRSGTFSGYHQMVLSRGIDPNKVSFSKINRVVNVSMNTEKNKYYSRWTANITNNFLKLVDEINLKTNSFTEVIVTNGRFNVAISAARTEFSFEDIVDLANEGNNYGKRK